MASASKARCKQLALAIDAARAAVLALHAAAGLATSCSKQGARALRAAEGLSRSAVSVLQSLAVAPPPGEPVVVPPVRQRRRGKGKSKSNAQPLPGATEASNDECADQLAIQDKVVGNILVENRGPSTSGAGDVGPPSVAAASCNDKPGDGDHKTAKVTDMLIDSGLEIAVANNSGFAVGTSVWIAAGKHHSQYGIVRKVLGQGFRIFIDGKGKGKTVDVPTHVVIPDIRCAVD